MSDYLTVKQIKNGNWYLMRDRRPDAIPERVYTTEYNGNYYIKIITKANQQAIILVPADEKIFIVPQNIDELDDEDDKYDVDDEEYLEDVESNKLDNFSAFSRDDANIINNLTPAERLNLYNTFIKVEKDKDLQKGGKKKRKTIKRKSKCKGKKNNRNKKTSKRTSKRKSKR